MEREVSPFYIQRASLSFPGVRTTRRKNDVLFLLQRTSIQLAHAGLALKGPPNHIGSLTGSNESMSYSPSWWSAPMDDTVIVGDQVSEAI